MMGQISAKTRMALGLACLLVSVLCTGMMLGLVPTSAEGIMEGRATVCETIAVASSDYISRGELRRLEYLLAAVIERNSEIQSAGVRKANGQLVAKVGDHESMWQTETDEWSDATQLHVPIRSGQQKWGSVELKFRPLRRPGVVGWLDAPWPRMILFITASAYLLFWFYLRKMLAHLDPSKAVPRRVRAALDSLAEGLLVIDKSERIVLANQSFANWVGRGPDKLIGVTAGKLEWVKNEQGEALEAYPWVDAIRREMPLAGVMLGLRRRDRSIRILIANASPVLGHDGKYRGVLISFDDVTQLEQTKRELRVAKQIADDANQAKSEFLARMSHEIRTPMNAILGYTDVLRRGLDENARNRQEYLDTIHASGEHLLALINDILDLSKVEAGQMELELERCSPHRLITQVVKLLRSKATQKGIPLECEFQGRLPEHIVTDSVRFRQTLMNLAGNAIKFTDAGSVRIVARLVNRQPADQRVVVAVDVIDSGIGISPAAQQRIFQPFAQADSSVTRRFGGTGLGLAISRQLAEAMGGGIEVRSEEGQGSTFTVTIDCGDVHDETLVDSDTLVLEDPQEAAESTGIQKLPPARILVADDGEANRKLIDLVLGRAGVDVYCVEDGQAAVDAATAQPFDVILMDMQMPVMDGYTATRQLRQAGHSLPIIALTAHAMRGDEEKCRDAGCSGFLSKPIKIDRLLTTLSDVLSQRPNSSGPGSETMSTGMPAADPAQNLLEDVTDLVDEVAEQQPGGDPPLQRVAAGAAERIADPIHCSYPLDDPDFLEIATGFVDRLAEQLAAMRQACAKQDFAELARLAHWLKGSGGTAGFDAFTEPARELEQHAKAGDAGSCLSTLDHLKQLAERIELPTVRS